jgi:hypothetical protein
MACRDMFKRLFDLMLFAYQFLDVMLVMLLFGLRNGRLKQDFASNQYYSNKNSVSSPSSTVIVDKKYNSKRKYYDLMEIILGKNLTKLRRFIERFDKRQFEAICLCENDCDESKSTLLHYVTTKSDYNHMLEMILRYVSRIEVVDKYGMTPLIYAVRFANVNAVSMLVSRGARANAQDMYGWSSLHEATFLENLGGLNKQIEENCRWAIFKTGIL